MRHLFDKPLGAVSAPFGSCFKCDPWTAVAAGLQIAGSVYNNQVNAERAASDMATYLNLVKKQRDWQKEDQQWSEQYSKNLLDYQNQYNTPSAQLERFKRAGLNPYALMNNEGAIGSGNSQAMPSPNPSVRGAVTPFQRPMLDNPLNGAADKIFAASSLKSQRISSLAAFSKVLPDLVKSVGKEGAYRIASSYFGKDIDLNRIERMAVAEEDLQRIKRDHDDLLLSIESDFGPEKARLVNLNLGKEFDKLAEEILNLGSDRKVNDAKVKELLSSAAKNLAEKAHLNADTATINKLRDALYYEARGKANSAYARGQMDYYDSEDRKAKFQSDTYQRDLDRLVGTPDSELSTDQKILKKAVLVERRLGKVAKNLSPLNP